MRRIPLWARVAYLIGWLLSSAWFWIVLAVEAAGSDASPYPTLLHITFWALLLGAIWPVSLPLMLW